MRNKPTITIGIPAHNEERTISNLLESISTQDSSHYKLDKVYVACDGCSDNTAKIAGNFRNVTIIDDGYRKGQAARLSEFYALNKSDIFVTFDADVVLEHKNVLNEIVKSFKNPIVGIVGGNPIPFVPTNLVEKFIVTWLEIWYLTRKDYKEGRNIHNHNGKVSAVTREAIEGVIIPADIYSNDDFLFVSIVKKGFVFEFAQNARVLYKVPNNLKDYFLQHGRFISLKENIIKYFGDDTEDIYIIQSKYKIKAFVKVFFKHPINTSIAVLFEAYLRLFKDKLKEKYEGVSWTKADSTKGAATTLKGAF